MYLARYTLLVSAKPVVPREILEYLTPEGRSPFHEWIRGLKDIKTRAIVRQRINRVRLGNLGYCKRLTSDISELKIDYGPGYRIYFAEHDDVIVILLCGGDKSTQRADIQQAVAYWQKYWRAGHAEANTEL